MTVINPNSISGITSITMPSGDGNVLTIHTNDGIERFRIDSSGNVKVGSACTISQDGDVFFTGVTTATTFTGAHSGSGANLTSLPAGNLTGTLPALDGSALTGVASTENIRTNTNATFLQNINVSGITTVGGGVTISESGIEASGIGITVANINGGAVSGRRNFLINGAMQVNQRNTNHSVDNSFNPVTSAIHTLDRWKVMNGSTFDTDSAKVLKAADGPDGFSSCLKWDIGNSETPSSSQNCGIEQKIEAQNLQGLAYGSSGAKTMTLSFYVKTNKTGTYCVHIMQEDGTKYQMHEYTVSSSGSWVRYVIPIVGNTSDAINDDTGTGLRIIWVLTVGSGDTVAATSTWASGGDLAGTSNQVNLFDDGSNYWSLTGCQLEIGTQATEFEHRSFGEELALCQRYFHKIQGDQGDKVGVGGYVTHGSEARLHVTFPQTMRSNPTLSGSGTAQFDAQTDSADFNCSDMTIDNTPTGLISSLGLQIITSGMTGGQSGGLRFRSNSSFISFDAEV